MDNLSLLNLTLRLHKEEQHSSIVQLLEVLLESPNGLIQGIDQTSTSAKEIVSQQVKSALFFNFGDALFRQKYFKRALRAFEQSLLLNDTGLRRTSKRSKTVASSINCDTNKSSTTSFDEHEIRHRMHLCKVEMHEISDARNILEKIPPHERSVKVLSSLANLYCHEKCFLKARDIYLELLKREPLCFDAVLKLCKLNKITYDEIIQVIPDDIKSLYSWYPTWIQAQCSLHSPNSKQAIRLFNRLTSRFERNASILTCLAQAYYYDGNFSEAIRIFKIAYSSDPLCFSRIDSYASCLHKESQKRQLEDLSVMVSPRCWIEGSYFHEPWLVMSHYYASKDKKDPRALLFVQKAYQLNRNSVEALILLARLFLEKKDSLKCNNYILSAHLQAPYRYEVQKILCDASMLSNRKATALAYAKQAVIELGETGRSYYIYADVMLKMQDQRRRTSAKSCMEKAVSLDPGYVPAVIAFADLLIEDKKFDQAIDVLNKALEHNPTNSELHRRLYSCHTEKKDFDKALDHQNYITDITPLTKTHHQITHARVAELQVPNEEPEQVLGFEADELVEGDNEADESSNLE